jgi:hypothetical protein
LRAGDAARTARAARDRASSTRIEFGKANGASWWLAKILPRCRTQPVGEAFVPASGPKVWSRCRSLLSQVCIWNGDGITPSASRLSTWSSPVTGRGSAPAASPRPVEGAPAPRGGWRSAGPRRARHGSA